MDGLCRGVTVKWKRAPLATPGGNVTCSGRWTCSIPVPAQRGQRSVQLSPRPPQSVQVQRRIAFAAEKRAAHAIDRRRDRRKIHDHFIGKAIRIVAGVVTRQHCNAIAAEWPERLPAHQLWLR